MVLLIAFTGTLTADQTLFYIGRRYGPDLLKRKPHWNDKVERIFKLLHKHNLGFILTFRFIYGIRTLSPLVIGASGFDNKRFAVLNLIAAVIWTILSCSTGYFLGYFFGDTLEDLINKAMRYQKLIVFTLIGVFTITFLIKKWWDTRQNKKTDKMSS